MNLPGLSVSSAEMLDSLERLGGSAARARVRCEVDPHIARIVGTWPEALDVSRPLALGFSRDRDIDAVVQQFIVRPVGQGFSPALRPCLASGTADV